MTDELYYIDNIKTSITLLAEEAFKHMTLDEAATVMSELPFPNGEDGNCSFETHSPYLNAIIDAVGDVFDEAYYDQFECNK
ncbi:hypothetical protein [Scandinavium manionii]|uniref:hypothetical protein n=1 Tax=Scandinavium manionii TaxID=2926520 RepID=UPI0021652D1C|nr:hypothetical protein [Scandinavium manionii]MCS2147680.1 hypothetical protein [Scandinavium manionii]